MNATLSVALEWPGRETISAPVVTSQSFTVWSLLAEARRGASGANAMSRTAAVCPRKVRVSRPAAMSQMGMVPSSQPAASQRPSGENATAANPR